MTIIQKHFAVRLLALLLAVVMLGGLFIVGAQAANELLNIRGIKASFVLTEYSGKIHISARSIDEVNVQLIMERMGGGGHLSVAACQLEGTQIEEAIGELKNTIDSMMESGEI